MDGKEKCRALKQIRKQIAENNDISYVVEECKHKGKCKGTCPKCESEVRYLENELKKRRSLGKKVALAGVSMGIFTTLSACTPTDVIDSVTYPIRDVFNIDFNGGLIAEPLGGAAEPYPLEGDVAAPVDEEGEVPEILDGEQDVEVEEDVDGEDADDTDDETEYILEGGAEVQIDEENSEYL